MPNHEKFSDGAAMSPETVDKARKIIEARAMNEHALEAAAQAEDIIRWLQQEWASRGFSPEQCVFAVALATINLRESMPEKYGGKEMFDRVAAEARAYYNANK